MGVCRVVLFMFSLLLATAIGFPGATSLHEFKINSLEGKETPLSKYKGKVALVVNVASHCGLTPQYKELQELYNTYKAKGFVILAFPANDFAGQEPGNSEEIRTFCTNNYGVTFPMFSKITVKGEGIHPIYKWLIANADRHDDIEWNFAKFLVDKQGHVVGRFTPQTKPSSAAIKKAIEEQLSK